MNLNDILKKQTILINYLNSVVKEFTDTDWKIKAEYSTNDNDKRVIVVQEQPGQKEVFFGEVAPLYNYYSITIYGLSIQECKNMSIFLGTIIGKDERIENKIENKLEKWQIMFKQFSNPQPIEYMDIRRVGYNMTLQCIINKFYEKEEE